MFTMNLRRLGSKLAVGAALAAGGIAAAGLPVTGWPVPELQVFDDAMQNYMATYGISAGVLAVMRDGCVVYQRGFGTNYDGNPLSENTPFRIASVEKPLVAAAIRALDAEGLLDLNDFAFNLGQPGGGILNITPWNGLGDQRYRQITVQHLIDHRGGFDRSVFGDPQFMALTIANAMGVASPPGRINTVRYMLSQQLQYTPGTVACDANGQPAGCYMGDMYSNFGYMVLGMIAEEVTGQSLETVIESRVLRADMWVPSTEIIFGRTFRANQSAREPLYLWSGFSTNVFNPNGLPVPTPYGGWEHEVFRGHGNLVVSAAGLLTFADTYTVWPGAGSGVLLNGNRFNAGHWGLIDGASTAMTQRTDGVNIVVLFNKRHGSGQEHYAGEMTAIIGGLIDSGVNWPTRCVDGFWVDFNVAAGGFGGYDDPFQTMTTALNSTTHGTRLRIKPGSTSWTGTINELMRLDAPLGMARIGQ